MKSMKFLRGYCAHRSLSSSRTPRNKHRERSLRGNRTRRLERLENRLVFSTVPIDTSAFSDDLILSTTEAAVFSGSTDSYQEVAHSDLLELEAGTIAVSFVADETDERSTLFSKDHSGFEDGGHLTAQIVDGRVEARLQSDEKSVKLRSADGSIVAGQEHQIAVSFGAAGFRLYVDGLIADAEVDFAEGIAENDNSLIYGASTMHRNGERLNLRDPLDGVINSVMIYDDQYGFEEMAALAGEELPPVVASEEGLLIGEDRDEYLFDFGVGHEAIHGGYGDDFVIGIQHAETLDGGHGQDLLFGGAGDDVLVSRSDGREPVIAQLYDADDDPYDEVDPETRTLYSDQPIASDDMLIGGEGADTFRFEILINAKERILFKHVNDDGTIDWKGVTGENRLVHDHWVDRIGDEVIYDFDRSEGDTIEVVGHTVDVYKLTHLDSDGDGVLDASVLHVQSNQGNAGAHNKDQLGTITVYGDLVKESDYTVHAHANLGIIETIGELGEALAPRYGDPVETDGQSRWLLPEVQEAETLPADAIFSVGQALEFSGDTADALQIPHAESLALDSGTIELAFTADAIGDRHTLFSKDHSGFEDGGHITAQIVDSRIEVRLQSDERSVKLKSTQGSIVAGEEYKIKIGFGAGGFQLFVDDTLVDEEADFTQGIAANENSLLLGASTKSRQGERLNLRDPFAGVLHSFVIYGAANDADAEEISAEELELQAVDLALAAL